MVDNNKPDCKKLEYHLNYQTTIDIFSIFDSNIQFSTKLINLLERCTVVLQNENLDVDLNSFVQYVITFAKYIKDLLVDGGIFFSDGEEITIEKGDFYSFENIFMDSGPIYSLTYREINNHFNKIKFRTEYDKAQIFLREYLELFGDVQNHLTKILLIPENLYKSVNFNKSGLDSSDVSNDSMINLVISMRRMLENYSGVLLKENSLEITLHVLQILFITRELTFLIFGYLKFKSSSEQ